MTYAPTPEAPPQPQLVIIRSDGKESAAAEALPDYSYAGCHAIPNGYYCGSAEGAH